jgi:hypothetical protein
MIYWWDIVLNRCGDAIGGLYRIGAPQPAHEPYRHTGPSHAAMELPSAREVFPVLSKAWHVMLARGHCRRSQQEIKS